MLAPEYVAGYFDGEGCIGLYAVKPYGHMVNNSWSMRVVVANTDPTILRELQEMFGCKVTVHKGPTPNSRKQFQWQPTNKACIKAFLTWIRPFMREKAKQADLLLAYINRTMPPDDVCKQLKEAKRVVYT